MRREEGIRGGRATADVRRVVPAFCGGLSTLKKEDGMKRVSQLVRLAVTQLRMLEPLSEAGRREELAAAWESLKQTMIQLMNELGLRKEKP